MRGTDGEWFSTTPSVVWYTYIHQHPVVWTRLLSATRLLISDSDCSVSYSCSHSPCQSLWHQRGHRGQTSLFPLCQRGRDMLPETLVCSSSRETANTSIGFVFLKKAQTNIHIQRSPPHIQYICQSNTTMPSPSLMVTPGATENWSHQKGGLSSGGNSLHHFIPLSVHLTDLGPASMSYSSKEHAAQ